MAFLCDIVLLGILSSVAVLFFPHPLLLQNFLILAVFYYLILPLFLNGSTLAQRFLNIEVKDQNKEHNKVKLILRKILAIAIYIVIPLGGCYLVFNIPNEMVKELLGIIIISLLFMYYLFSALKYIFTNKKMIYEKISKTSLVSTIE